MMWAGQGWSLDETVRLSGGVFSGVEAIAGVIYPAGAGPDSALPIVPACSWRDFAADLVNYSLTPTQSAAIPVGHYKTTVAATIGDVVIGLAVDDLYVYPTGRAYGIPAATTVTGPTAADLAYISTLYCTDEDIAKKCVSDFAALIPPAAVLAAGTDGVFAPADPWTLTSGSNDFAAQGLAVGHVVQLRRPASAFAGQGQLMAVAAVSGSSLTLRHLGLPTNFGRAPAPALGLVGVDFLVGTFGPQIEEATYDLNQRYSIDAAVQGRAPAGLRDTRPLRRACVCMVLIDRYGDESRASVGNYADKLASLRQELDDLMAKLQLRWLDSLDDARITNWFSTRVVR